MIVVVLVCVGMFVGGIAQRLVGSGYALIVAPLLVILLPPASGVLVVSIGGAVCAALVFLISAKDVQWRRFLWITIPAIFAVVPGVLLSKAGNSNALKVATGVVVLISLVIAGRLARSSLRLTSSWPAGVAGFGAGLLTSSVGVGVPAITAYGVLSRWEQRPFAATLQPYFVAISATTLLARLLLVPASVPDWTFIEWSFVLGSLLVGLLLGSRLVRIVSPAAARVGMLIVAYAGALSAILIGGYDLLR